MKTAALLLPAMLAGCATTAADLGDTEVKTVIESRRSAQAFATCTAENFTGNPQLRSDGNHYWVVGSALGIPRIRWDFTPTANGSRAEKRSTALGSFGDNAVRACAS